MLGLEAKNIGCCVHGHMLYWDNEFGKDDGALIECKFYRKSRYHVCKAGKYNYKPINVKSMFYFPKVPRLKGMFSMTKVPRKMTWNYENKSTLDILHHPSDGELWTLTVCCLAGGTHGKLACLHYMGYTKTFTLKYEGMDFLA